MWTMSLRYRLTLLTLLVFAATIGAGTILAQHSAALLAQRQLLDRLGRTARALADSGTPLGSDQVLSRYGPLLDADILVLAKDGRVIAHSQGQFDWQALAAQATLTAADASSVGRALPAVPDIDSKKGGRYPPYVQPDGKQIYFALAQRPLPPPEDHLLVCALAQQQRLEETTGLIFRRYLMILGITALLLAGGSYLVGMATVRRLKRLAGQVDSAFAEGQPPSPRGGDEITRLSESFADLLARLQESRQRLLAQQRLATTGKLASSVAHEVRNPLQAMRLTVQMLREKCPPDSRPGCDLVIGEIDRLAMLTDELLVLAGKTTAKPEEIDLASELDETLRLLKLQLRQRDLRTRLEMPPLPPVRIDRNRCRQLLLNLLLNAIEASPGGGTIGVQGSLDGGRVALRITDGGSGFPAEILAGSVEDFFSTKSSGAGLGLPICRRIVQEAGGQLRLSNVPGGGAAAEVVLPV